MKTTSCHLCLLLIFFSAVILLPCNNPLAQSATAEEQRKVNSDADVETPAGGDLSKEFPVDEPALSEADSLREHVAFCATQYRKVHTLCVHGAKGGDVGSELEVYYEYRMAKARLFRLEGKYTDCRKEAAAAVSTAKALVHYTVSTYEPREDQNSFVANVNAHVKLTEARSLLAQVNKLCESKEK